MSHLDVLGVRRHLNGWRPELADHRDHYFELAMPMAVAPLPSTIDLTAICPRVEDQQWLGSCVACSTTSLWEAVRKKLGLSEIQMSRLFVYWWGRHLEKTPADHDTGMNVRTAMKVLAALGVCLETTWPYVPEQYVTRPPEVAETEAAHHKLIAYKRCASLLSIRQSLAQGFPVVGGFAVPENMMSPECAQTGAVQYPRSRERFVGGHAVLFMGYSDTAQRLFFQNSWGVDWGAGGCGSLLYRFVESGLADDFWTIRAEEV